MDQKHSDVIGYDKSDYAGKKVFDERSKDRDETFTLQDVLEDVEKSRIRNIEECINRGCVEHGFGEPFFVVLRTKTESGIGGALRDVYAHRKSCPTPTFDQNVFFYNAQTGDLNHCWTIPSKDAAEQIRTQGLMTYTDGKDTYTLGDETMKKMVDMFYDGTLMDEVMRANGETV